MSDFKLVLEPVSLRNPEWGRVADLVAKNYPNSCIIRIESVVSRNQDEYDTRLGKLGITPEEPKDRTEKSPVWEMFHGTKEKYVPGILKEGLKCSKNVVSAYGKGTYFSPFIKTSLHGYTDVSRSTKLSYVFLCDVVMKDTGGNKSNIYVCPRDDSFVIKYLIRFHKDAP